MNIFDYFNRDFSIVRYDGIISVRARMNGRDDLGYMNVFYITDSQINSEQLLRVLNGDTTTYNNCIRNINSTSNEDGTVNIKMTDSNNINNQRNLIKISRMNTNYCSSNNIGILEEFRILKELSRVLCSILCTGHMPIDYFIRATVNPFTETEKWSSDETELEKEYEDVFHGDTLIERIKNCGDIYGDAKAFPIIVRNGSNKMKIIDTSIEDNILYIDVENLPKKDKESGKTKGCYRFPHSVIDAMESNDMSWDIIPNNTYVTYTETVSGT